MSPRNPQAPSRTKCCERCGRTVPVNSRKRAVVVCFDCRWADPEWLRMVGAA